MKAGCKEQFSVVLEVMNPCLSESQRFFGQRKKIEERNHDNLPLTVSFHCQEYSTFAKKR